MNARAAGVRRRRSLEDVGKRRWRCSASSRRGELRARGREGAVEDRNGESWIDRARDVGAGRDHGAHVILWKGRKTNDNLWIRAMRRAKCGTQTCEKHWTVERVVPDALEFGTAVPRGV